MNNIEIRNLIKSKRLYYYEVAAQIGITEFCFSRWLRKELDESRRSRVLDAIKALTEVK